VSSCAILYLEEEWKRSYEVQRRGSGLMMIESRKTGTAALAAVLLLVSVSQAQPPHQHEISPPEGTPSAEFSHH
jgi:hypothetical protein